MYADLLAILVQQNGGEQALATYDRERTEMQQNVNEAAVAGDKDLQASMSRDVKKLDGKIAVLTKAIDLHKTWREKVKKMQKQPGRKFVKRVSFNLKPFYYDSSPAPSSRSFISSLSSFWLPSRKAVEKEREKGDVLTQAEFKLRCTGAPAHRTVRSFEGPYEVAKAAGEKHFKDDVKFSIAEFDALYEEMKEELACTAMGSAYNMHRRSQRETWTRCLKRSLFTDKDRLYVFLSACRSGKTQKDIAWEFRKNRDAKSIREDFWTVCDILFDKIVDKHMKWPDEVEQAELAKMTEEYTKGMFGKSIGALDGWAHQTKNTPISLEALLFSANKYNAHAVINLLFCDIRGRILFVVPGVMGHGNDQIIATAILNDFKHIIIKPGLNVFGDAIFNHDQILTPLPNCMIDGGTTNFGRTVVPRPDEKERKEYIDYNKDHSRGRIVVENVFSRLQRTWSVLGQPLRFRPDRGYKKLVVVLCALWNRLCDTGVQKFPRDLKRTNHVYAWERKLHRERVRTGYDGFLNENENVGLDYDSQDDEW